MNRLTDWEQRLNDFIARARLKPYQTHEWNCCLFARECVHVLTGTLLPAVWRGTMVETWDGAGLQRTPPTHAQRGDLVLIETPEETIGVCLGVKSAFVGLGGFIFLKTSRASVAWRVG
jgi:hypothetical protein